MNKPAPSHRQSPTGRVIKSIGLTFTICIAVVFGCLSFYHFQIAASQNAIISKEITYAEALSFAGVMVTILAFISAFYILLLAIDAFKISSEVSENAYSIQENKEVLDDLSTKIEIEEERLALLKSDASLSSDLLRELNSSADEFADLLNLLDRASRALELSGLAYSEKSTDAAVRVIEHAGKIRKKIPALSVRNMSRQSRIIVLSQLASDPSEVQPMVLERALLTIRTEAVSGDTTAKILLEKYKKEH